MNGLRDWARGQVSKHASEPAAAAAAVVNDLSATFSRLGVP